MRVLLCGLGLIFCFDSVRAQQTTAEFRQTSVPQGIINSLAIPEVGSTVSTTEAPLQNGNFYFAEWTINGVRASDASGGSANPVRFTIDGNSDAVAVYLPEDEDSDADTLMDWWELRYHGVLSFDATDNPDGDLFGQQEEQDRNQHPGVFDEQVSGGISRRRSSTIITIQDRIKWGILTESSSPQSAVLRSRRVEKNVPTELINPPSQTGGYAFTGWLLDGQRFDRPLDIQPITIIPTADYTEYVARYIRTDDNTDGDDVPDWREQLLFESLQYDSSADPDNDNFSWREEDERGFSTLAHDELESGGLSRRRSKSFFIDTTGRILYRQDSRPETIVDSTEYLPAGTFLTVPLREGTGAFGYRFAWYSVNGVRQEDSSGSALPAFSIVLSEPTTLTANYLRSDEDSDFDGIEDYLEMAYYGSLDFDGTSNTDGDGYNFAQELILNQSPRLIDDKISGGISRRRSKSFFVDTTGRIPLRITSSPESILEQITYHSAGSVVSLQDLENSSDYGYRFSWWSYNGIRLEDASGAALGRLSFIIEDPVTAIAHYISSDLDADGDGILDWVEYVYYGDTSNEAASNTDGDAFDFATELALNQSPRISDTQISGGISRRRSSVFPFDPLIEPDAPKIGNLLALNVGQSTATLRALINPMSVATTAYFDYGTTPALGLVVFSTSILNGFQSEPMDGVLGNLIPDTEYFYRVVTENDFGQTSSEISSFRTLPNFAGFDGWQRLFGAGALDIDEEGDGYTNLEEYAFGGHPLRNEGRLSPYEIELFDNRMRLRYLPNLAVNDVIYGAEFSFDLDEWIPLSDSNNGPLIEFWTPEYEHGFIRWRLQLME